MAPNDLNFARLLDWLEGRLPAAEANAIAAAIQDAVAQGDTQLQRTVDWLRAFRVLSNKPALAEPSAPARAAVHALIRRRAPQNASAPASFVRRIIATLLPPSPAGLAGAGVRGNNLSGALRQLTYTSSLADIIVNIVPSTKLPTTSPISATPQVGLQGLVLPLADLALDQMVVQLLRDGVEAGLTFTNELGEFAFEAVPYGSYALVLFTAQADIEVGPLTLNA